MDVLDEALRDLAFALAKYPEKVEAVPLDGLLVESARENPKRPAYLKLAVPDEVVKALRGARGARDLYLLVKVPREVQQRAQSPIVLPREVR